MKNFCAGMSASSSCEWSVLDGLTGSMGKDVRVMVQSSVCEPGVPPGVVLSVATAVWLPVTPERLFNFLRDEELRAEWDILSNGGPMQQMLSITKGQLDGNSVTLLRADVSISCHIYFLIPPSMFFMHVLVCKFFNDYVCHQSNVEVPSAEDVETKALEQCS